MSTKPQIELFLENESGTQQVVYPFVESDHVSLTNGMNIDTMIRQDVSMPTVTHEDLSFKVGVGDSDVSSAIVDSSVAEMTIKGKTYQNILPEPTLRNTMTDGKTMQKINEGYENVEVVDGVSKSAILKGQTLVNVNRSNFVVNSAITGDYKNAISKFDTDMKASTTYTVIAYSDNQYEYRLSEMRNTTDEVGLNNERPLTVGVPTVFTTNENFTSLRGYLKGNTLNIPQGTEIKILIIEGDHSNENIPYFEGMQSVKMPVLTTTGKNLFDASKTPSSTNFGMNLSVVNNKLKLSGTPTRSYASHLINTTLKKGKYYAFQVFVDGALHSGTGYRLWGYGGSDLLVNATSGGVFKPSADVNLYLVWEGLEVGVAKTIENIEIQIEESPTPTTYEPYKSNILSCNSEVVLRSLPNGVCDTLDLMTGELVQRIGEKMLNGASNEGWFGNYKGTSYQFVLPIEDATSVLKDNKVATLNSDTIPSVPNHTILSEELNVEKWGIAQRNNGNKGVFIAIPASTIETYTVESFKQWLAQNPITVQYELATPIIKTVDLSTSGNWEKVVLNGSESSWTKENVSNNIVRFKLGGVYGSMRDGSCVCDTLPCYVGQDIENVDYVRSSTDLIWVYQKDILQTVEQFKSKLQQNPLTVWYQTQTHQDSTNVKEVLSFSNGHIQLSSGVENSLIPSLSYEVPTSNSYHLDLAKASTQYTMKSSQSTGTFTIDGTQYNVTSNGVFTTPSSMTDKLMITSSSVSDMMLLEGDMREKDIPYFKGIKSAFEDESKIEVLSTGKNLYDGSFRKGNIDSQGNAVYNESSKNVLSDFILAKPNMTYTMSNHGVANKTIFYCQYDSNKQYVGAKAGWETKTLDSNVHYIRIQLNETTKTIEELNNEFMLEESSTATQYETYKSNSTKIPLLSPLRSLPNGVCDEITLDRENNKAKIIQRVEKVVLDGSEAWTTNSSLNTTETTFFFLPNSRIPNTWGRITSGWRRLTNDRFASSTDRSSAVNQKIEWISGGDSSNGMIQVLIKKGRLSTPDVSGFKQWLSLNPVTVQYELETPIVTEVDLEGFPYVYKDGHIFLNGEITPVTEIKYSINQQHQIEASNQDLIRQEKKLTNLQRLIGEYVRVDYNSTLLSLELELK